jgi:hypothetical protein
LTGACELQVTEKRQKAIDFQHHAQNYIKHWQDSPKKLTRLRASEKLLEAFEESMPCSC